MCRRDRVQRRNESHHDPRFARRVFSAHSLLPSLDHTTRTIKKRRGLARIVLARAWLSGDRGAEWVDGRVRAG